MEEGSLRCDANVSMRPVGEPELGTKTELKNMNSFRFLERGIEAEIERQAALLRTRRGGRAGDAPLRPAHRSLTSLRSKEEAHDYRYFPEPDLVPLAPTEADARAARAALPELPAARLARYEAQYGLAGETAAVLWPSEELGNFFEESLATDSRRRPRLSPTGSRASWSRACASRDWRTHVRRQLEPRALAELVTMVQSEALSRPPRKEVLA